jgi:hypothetical protein
MNEHIEDPEPTPPASKPKPKRRARLVLAALAATGLSVGVCLGKNVVDASGPALTRIADRELQERTDLTEMVQLLNEANGNLAATANKFIALMGEAGS